MAIQEVNTMIFEIQVRWSLSLRGFELNVVLCLQELRHTTMPVVETTFLRAEAVGSSPPLRPSDSISNAPSELSLPPPAGSSDASSTAASGDKAPTGLSQVDEALMRLDSKLEVVGKVRAPPRSKGSRRADFPRRNSPNSRRRSLPSLRNRLGRSRPTSCGGNGSRRRQSGRERRRTPISWEKSSRRTSGLLSFDRCRLKRRTWCVFLLAISCGAR